MQTVAENYLLGLLVLAVTGVPLFLVDWKTRSLRWALYLRLLAAWALSLGLLELIRTSR